MEYARLVQRAASLTWKHKSLWLFGVAVALFGGGTAGGGNANGLQYAFSGQDMERLGRVLPRHWEQFAAGALAAVAALGVLALILGIIGILVRYTSQGALIGLADEAERSGDVSVNTGIHRGWKSLINLFLVSLVIGIGAIILVFTMVVFFALAAALVAGPAALMFRAGNGWTVAGVIWSVVLGLAVLACLVLAIIFIAGALTVIQEYAWRAVVLGGSGVMDAIGRAISLARARWRESAGIWVVLGLLQIAVGLVLAPVMLAMGGAALVPAVALWRATETAIVPALMTLPVLALGAAVLLLIGGVYTAFNSVVWTLVYRELVPVAET